MRSHWRPKMFAALAILLVGCQSTGQAEEELGTTVPANNASTETSTVPLVVEQNPLTGTIGFEVVEVRPHDPLAFTQGLEFADDQLVESTGLRGQSDLRTVDEASGAVLQQTALAPEFFAEGVTERNGRLYQLTYTAGQVLISDTDTLQSTGDSFRYEGEGWGLCSTDSPQQPFIMSNGSDVLTIRDPETFEVTAETHVVDEAGIPLFQLNELECVGDQVLANIWMSDDIVAIDLATGQVVGRLDLTELVPLETRQDNNAVLNGIAYRQSTDTYFVTGKRWPVMYELRLTSG